MSWIWSVISKKKSLACPLIGITINKIIKIGFTLTVLFVFITILMSIYSQTYLHQSLVEVDVLHGSAEFFLTLSDFIILFGFLKMLNQLEVNNS